MMKNPLYSRLVLLLFVIATVWYSFYSMQPPAPKSADAPETEFSAQRAFEHVQQIAKEPHPLGSAANDSAMKYIMDELRELDLHPVIQMGVGANISRGIAGNTSNIFARINGSDPEKTILLMAHYDSVPNAPGAADDASGVATILETLRALQARETPPKNNIWILLTDGEERGLLGARLFTDTFWELDKIDLVLNFEARGSSGPSMMFETSSPNGKLIQHFARATPAPVANSLMYTVYKLLPNDTDLSVFKRAGLNGLNFAFTEDFLNYHTMQDTPENLSLASLQHHGSNMMGNVLHFGNENFELGGDTDYVYFMNLAGGLLYYPSGWSFPLALVTALLFIAYLVYLFRTNTLRIGAYLGSLLIFLGCIAAATAITYYGWQGIRMLHPEYRWLAQGEVYGHIWYLLAFSSLVMAMFFTVYGLKWLRRKIGMQELLCGSYTVWIAASLITAWHLPTASYLLTWPALLGLAGWIVLGEEIEKNSWKTTGVLALSLFPVLFMIPPYLYLVQVMLTTGMIAISMAVLVLILGLAWPACWLIVRERNTIWNSAFLALSLVFFIGASQVSDYGADQKKQNSIFFAQNMDTGEAYWISRDDTTDTWTRQFLGDDYRTGNIPDMSLLDGRDLLFTKTATADIPRPDFQIVSDSASDSLRYLHLRIDTGQPGVAAHIGWEPETLEEISVHGKRMYSTLSPLPDQPRALSRIFLSQDLSDPLPMKVVLDASREPVFEFTFINMGLPTHILQDYRERPPQVMPPPYGFSNSTLWKTSVSVDTLDQ